MLHDPEAPIDLLQQNHPHQLMGEGHSGKAQRIVRPLQDGWGKAQGTADDEGDVAYAPCAQSLDFPGKLQGIQHLSLDGQGDHIGVVPDGFQNPAALPLPDGVFFRRTGPLRRLLVCQLHDLQLTVTAQTLFILPDGLGQIFFFDFSYGNTGNLHAAPLLRPILFVCSATAQSRPYRPESRGFRGNIFLPPPGTAPDGGRYSYPPYGTGADFLRPAFPQARRRPSR